MRTAIQRKELERLLKTNTAVQVAEILGVSRATIERAKKIYGIKRSYKDFLATIVITEEEFNILYGTLLGDGHVAYFPEKGIDAYYRAEQGEKQKEYLFWKYDKLKNLCLGEPKKSKASWYFQTRCLPDITTLYSQFYKDRKKVLPESFESTINEQMVAVWYLDDGTRSTKQQSADLCVQGFSYVDIGRIIATLKVKFGIECLARKQADVINIRFSKDGTIRLFDKIRKYVNVDSMMYKIYPCNDYVRKILTFKKVD
jgi:recombination protein RecA